MDTSSWNKININKIFDISYGNKLDMCQMTPNSDGIPFVTRTATNNGVGGIVEPVDGVTAYPAGSLSVALGGSIGSTFLQTSDFYTSQNVAVLQPKETLPSVILLFLAALIEKECSLRFVAFGRELNKHIKRNFTIKLPLEAKDKPNWKELEDFIKDRILPQLPKKAQKVWLHKYETEPLKKETMKLNTDEWKWFRYDKVFDIKHGFYNKKPEDDPEGNIPFIGATDSNNGVTSHTDLETIAITTKTGDGNNAPIEEKIFDNCIAVTNNGSVGYAYYQAETFTCTHDVNPLYIKGHDINPYIALFLCTLIERERFRWAYGRKWRPIRMPSSMIKLPSLKKIVDGKEIFEPDWQFMEDYIKSLPYSKNLEPSDPKEVVDELMEVKRHVIEMERKMEALNGAATVNIIGSNVTYLDQSRTFHVEK